MYNFTKFVQFYKRKKFKYYKSLKLSSPTHCQTRRVEARFFHSLRMNKIHIKISIIQLLYFILLIFFF